MSSHTIIDCHGEILGDLGFLMLLCFTPRLWIPLGLHPAFSRYGFRR
jgi:hypothetical protein